MKNQASNDTSRTNFASKLSSGVLLEIHTMRLSASICHEYPQVREDFSRAVIYGAIWMEPHTYIIVVA